MGSSFTAPNEMRNSSRWYKAEIEGAAPECDKSSLNKKAAWASSIGASPADLNAAPWPSPACHAGAHPLLDQRALKLGERTKHLKHRLTCRRGGIEALLMQVEIDLDRVQFG